RWVSAALDAFRADSRLAAVAARDDGPHADVPARAVLRGAPGGLVVETRAFHWVGGAGEERSVAGADVDLGWRLWRAGMAVAEVSASAVSTAGSDERAAEHAADLLLRRVADAGGDGAEPHVVRLAELAPLL